MGKLALYLFGAVWLGGFLMMAVESAGAIPVALFFGWAAWSIFGQDKTKS